MCIRPDEATHNAFIKYISGYENMMATQSLVSHR